MSEFNEYFKFLEENYRNDQEQIEKLLSNFQNDLNSIKSENIEYLQSISKEWTDSVNNIKLELNRIQKEHKRISEKQILNTKHELSELSKTLHRQYSDLQASLTSQIETKLDEVTVANNKSIREVIENVDKLSLKTDSTLNSVSFLNMNFFATILTLINTFILIFLLGA